MLCSRRGLICQCQVRGLLEAASGHRCQPRSHRGRPRRPACIEAIVVRRSRIDAVESVPRSSWSPRSLRVHQASSRPHHLIRIATMPPSLAAASRALLRSRAHATPPSLAAVTGIRHRAAEPCRGSRAFSPCRRALPGCWLAASSH